jgi:putative hydrolase of the HAD superfamily
MLDPTHIETWVFDLDNTIYPAAQSLFPQIDVRIRGYISRQLGMDLEDAYRLQKHYYREYGTTLRGLMSVHHIDPADFLEYVHDIDYSVLGPTPGLSDALGKLPGRKLIFTNGSEPHAQRVLSAMKIQQHFDDIFDIVAADFIPKPQMRAYEILGERCQVRFDRAAMIEDLERNLEPAAKLGMTTIWVKQDDHPDEKFIDHPSKNPAHIDHITEDLLLWLEQIVDLKPSLPPSCQPNQKDSC